MLGRIYNHNGCCPCIPRYFSERSFGGFILFSIDQFAYLSNNSVSVAIQSHKLVSDASTLEGLPILEYLPDPTLS